MKKYIGVKIIEATPAQKHTCTKNDCAEGIDGYKVVYPQPDGSTYESWSPKDVFEESYRVTSGMNFGLAIEALKKGYKVARSGWNGKGMWLILQTGSEVTLREGTCYHKAGLKHVKIDSHIDMFTAAGTMQPGWLASQADILADDWQIIK